MLGQSSGPYSGPGVRFLGCFGLRRFAHFEHKLGCFLSFAGCGEDRMFVAFQNFEPGCEIFGMLEFAFDAGLGAQESGAHLSHKLFGCIRFVTESFAELAVKPAFVACPVSDFVQQGAPITHFAVEIIGLGHADYVCASAVVGAGTAVLNFGARVGYQIRCVMVG